MRTKNRGSQARSSAPWRPTELQRDYRSLLDSAKEKPQTILDSDGSMLVIEPKDRADFYRKLVEHFAKAVQLQAVYIANQGKEPSVWAAQTPFPWLNSFNREEAEEFVHEFLAYALDAARRGTLDNFEGNLQAWHSTAEIYEQPGLLDMLTASLDPAKVQEVFPPSEAEAEANKA